MGGKKVCVIDGQGGGIGSALIRRLKEVYGESVEILALGTNAIATAQMMKARANRGATGENAIVVSLREADVVLGPVSVTWPDAMMGEVTPKMAAAVTACPAPKILLPLFKEKIKLVGLSGEPLPHLIDEIIDKEIKEFI